MMSRLQVLELRAPGAIGAVLFLVAALATPVHAITEPCVSITATCTDAVGAGQPIPFSGTVCNCNPSAIPLFDVTVEDGTHNGVFFGPVDLLPGACASWSYEWVPESDPLTIFFIVRAVDDPVTGHYIATSTSATCGVQDEPEICRTPGFWGTHAGTEKTGSRNITQAVIDAAGFLSVCGETVDNTLLKMDDSALEATCVSVKLGSRLQLARQLTATALNCVMTNGDPYCEGVGVAETFARCDLACALNSDFGDCIDELDCFNNGGVMLESGLCQIGTCGGDGVTACDGDESCGFDVLGAPIPCVPLPGHCHDALLVNEDLGLLFADPGPAGSSTACNAAIKSACTIFDCD